MSALIPFRNLTSVHKLLKITRLFPSITHLSGVQDNYSQSTCSYDIVIVGGGIIGLATARELISRHRLLKFALLEKEKDLATHQSGRNSGVIHAGIYYKPGTLKAKLCVEGLHLMYNYLEEKNIPYEKCGKLIVATDDTEIKRLDDLYDRALANKVPDVKIVTKDEIKMYEPYCQGVKAIWSPHTGIVDYRLVSKHYAQDFMKLGGIVYCGFEVTQFKFHPGDDTPVHIADKNENVIKCKYVLTCGGLHSDRLAELSGCSADPKIVPFRGEYLLLHPKKRHLVKGNIYPVPDPRFPFLGVHFTPRMDGAIWLGPNAVPALKREGYGWSHISPSDICDFVKYPGFQKLAYQYVGFGTKEVLRSIFYQSQVKALQKYIPQITKADVERGPSGVRAQALNRSGELVEDFVFDNGVGDIVAETNVLMEYLKMSKGLYCADSMIWIQKCSKTHSCNRCSM